MRREPLLLWALLAVACAASPAADAGAGNPPRGDAGGGAEAGRGAGIQIATWNVRRLFDAVCDSRACGGDHYEPEVDEGALRRRASAVAGGVRGLAADVVLLQEIESQAALDAVHASLDDLFPAARIAETGGAASLDVAVLSRVPITEVRTHADVPLQRPDGSPTYFSRDLMEVHLDHPDGPVVVLVAHFKSKNGDDPGRRLAEGEAAGRIAAEVAAGMPGALVVLGGDLNDTPGSPPLVALEASGDLRRVAADLPEGEDGTYEWRGRRSALDHLYVVGEGYVAGSARVFCAGASGWAGSDHCALGASFRLVHVPGSL